MLRVRLALVSKFYFLLKVIEDFVEEVLIMIEHVLALLLLLSLLYLTLTCILLERFPEDEFVFNFRNAVLFFIFFLYLPFQPIHHLLLDVPLELGLQPSIDICEIIVCNC
jgi:hypothetical protein